MHSHSEALLAICLKPIMCARHNCTVTQDIKGLAECLEKYSQYLKNQNETQKQYHLLEHPARMLSDHCFVEHRSAASLTKPEYALLDDDVSKAGILNPVFF